MAESNALLEEGENEIQILLDFYQYNEIFLRGIHLYEIPYKLKEDIGIILFSESLGEDWKICLEELGLDHMTIEKIEFKAICDKKTPFHCALERPLLARWKSLGEVIEVFIRQKKFHILSCVKPFIEGLIMQHASLREEASSNCEPSAPLYEDSSTGECLQIVNGFDVNKSTQDSLKTSELYLFNSRGGHSGNGHNYNQRSHEQFQKCGNLSFQDQLRAVPKALKVELPFPGQVEAISVFVLHAIADSEWAFKLKSFLKKQNFKVITTASISDHIRMNPTKILKAINSKVDFLIPILSEVFMKQIRSTGEPDDTESITNYFMYDLAQNEYLCRGFQNYRVRAVCIPNERIQVHNDCLLSCFFGWDKAANLVQNLRKTKKMFL